MKALVKTLVLKPEYLEDDRVKILLYKVSDEEWDSHIFRGSTNLLDKMLAYANNRVIMKSTTLKDLEGYIFSEVEVTGLKASRGEGVVKNVETILYPRPQPLQRIVFLKKEDSMLKPVHEVKLDGEYWVYDSAIIVKNLEYDAILIETLEDKRIVLREEIIIPTRKKIGETTKSLKKKRRKRKTRKKKKTSAKKKKSRRKRSKRKKKGRKKSRRRRR